MIFVLVPLFGLFGFFGSMASADIIGDSHFQYRVDEKEVASAERTVIGPYLDAFSNQDRVKYEGSSSTTYFGSEVKKLAFGSCNFQRLSQKYFANIDALRPDVWVWTGDIIYADGLPAWLRQNEYNHVKSSPAYAAFRKNTAIVGVWDDHDYGRNDVGEEFRDKVASQRLLLDFLDEPKDSPRREQKGVYWTYRFGPADRQIRLIVLDLRYFRKPGVDAEVLGEAQWKWLEHELALGAEPAVTVIASSTEFLPFESHGDRWEEFPVSKSRLLDLVRPLPEKVIFLSGDVHFGEISRWDDAAYGKVLDEVTASGLTHAGIGVAFAKNRYRQGSTVTENHYGLLTFDWSGQVPQVLYELRSTAANKVLQSFRTDAARRSW